MATDYSSSRYNYPQFKLTYCQVTKSSFGWGDMCGNRLKNPLKSHLTKWYQLFFTSAVVGIKKVLITFNFDTLVFCESKFLLLIVNTLLMIIVCGILRSNDLFKLLQLKLEKRWMTDFYIQSQSWHILDDSHTDTSNWDVSVL